MTKRLLSLALAVLMVLSVPVFVFAEETDVPEAVTPETAGPDGITGDAVITLYDEPVVTTMGTKADLLAGNGGVYTAKTTGARGFAFIFKVEGSEAGDVIGMFDINVTARRITGTDDVGEKIYSDPETKGPIWNGNWVADVYSTNSVALWGDGYYIYWFPFKNIDNGWVNVETIEGETTINAASIFNKTGALGNGRAGSIVENPDVTVSCLGIIEGGIDAYDVIAYNKQTEEYEARQSFPGIVATSESNYAQWRKLPDLTDLFGIFYGADDGEYVASWKDRNGEAVSDDFSAQLGLKVVEPVYSAYDTEEAVTLTFVNSEGEDICDAMYINGVGIIDGSVPAGPARASDGIVSYDFAGWSLDGENIIDPESAEYEGDATIKPVYTEFGAHLSEGVVLPVVTSTVTEEVDETKTTTESNGNTIEYVTKTINVTTTYPGEAPTETYSSVQFKRTTDAQGVVIKEEYVDQSQQGDRVALDLLTKDVAIDPKANGVTFIYKVEGADDPIIADHLLISNLACKDGENNNWGWDARKSREGELTAAQLDLSNGYFYMYVNDTMVQLGNVGDAAKTIFTEFEIFYGFKRHVTTSDDGKVRGPENTNENAVFTMLAVANDNVQPTVTFHDADGEAIATYQHKYTDVNRFIDLGNSTESFQVGTLLTPAEIFALAQTADEALIAPAKDSGIDEVEYVLDGWCDADGNVVDAVYKNGDLYPVFKMVDNRTKYNVVFKNYDDTTLYECVVPEGVTPEYVGAIPKKPSTDSNSYEFIGWEPELAPMPITPEADGATAADTVVYTAKYNEIERRYDVIYYDEDGETLLDEDLYLVYESASTTDVVPTKDADVQYTYTFEKWVDLEGNDVDLSKVTSDMKVKAYYKATLNKYTVTFMDEDKETELGKSTVDYGTAATAPEATKADSEWHTYAFDKWVDAEGNEVSITEVKGDMTVYATYTPTFKPLDPNEPIPAWAADAVEYVCVNGIMNGMDGGFKPDTTMSRAMVVTVLYRYMDEPEYEVPEEFVNFTDNLDATSWYYDAVIWAAVNGVVNGRGNGLFDPNGNVTRQEFAAILYRFSDEVMGEYMGYGRSTLSVFYDRDQIDTWAHTAVKWAYATADDTKTQGIREYNKSQYITGAGIKDGKVIFAPKANATRAQVATMLYRYMTGERLKA